MSAITILVVDDHPVVRNGLSAMLSVEPDFQVIAEVGDGTAAVDAYIRLHPSIVILDLLLPDIGGIEVITQIYAKSPSARIIVLTTVTADEEIYRALEAGARGYLLKDMARRELVHAVREIHAGHRYIPSAVGARIAESLPRPGLTSREVEVLQMIASGRRNKEVAYALGVSEATVNAHIKHVFSKLNVSDRTHAVTVALRRGIIHL